MRNIKELTFDRVNRAFSPAKEIQDPKLFAGRTNEIREGIEGLMNSGGLLGVYGLRGVGKSSIAYQLKLIAEGDTTLPKELKLDRYIPEKNFNYIVHYVQCDSFVTNTVQLLARLVYGDDTNPSLFSLTKTGERKSESIKRIVKGGGSAGIAGFKGELGGTIEETFSNIETDDLVQEFRRLLWTIKKDNQDKDGMLILIDEFDIIEDTSQFSSLVKACSTDFVKFGIVGIASSITELIDDHSSVSRQFDILNVPVMPEHELVEVLNKAEYRVNYLITFTDEAKELIASHAEGFPFFAHLMGKQAMRLAFERYSPTITKDDVLAVGEMISEGRLKTIYDDRYHEAVKHSQQRELLLKAFAEVEDDEIFTEPVYALAKDLGVTNPPQLIKELTTQSGTREPILKRVRNRYYRFTDPVFKVYCRIRNWKFN